MNWRNQKNKSGLYPVHLCLGINDVYRYYYIEVPQKIKLNEWSGAEDGWVTTNHPYYFEINNKIIEKKAVVTALIKRCYYFNKQVPLDTIFNHLERK